MSFLANEEDMMSNPGQKERRRKAWGLHLQDEHLIAIGHVAVRAGMLDKLIELTAEQIIRGYPKILRDEVLGFSTPKKLKLIKDALIEEMEESKHAISEFVSEVSAARYERNDIIHKTWRATEAAEDKVLVELRHGETEKTVRRVSAKSMMALAMKMIDLTFEMADWKMRSNQVRQRRFGASLSIRPPIPLSTPPRISAKDPPQRQRTVRLSSASGSGT